MKPQRRRRGARGLLLAATGLALACAPPPRIPRFAEPSPAPAGEDGLRPLVPGDFPFARARPEARLSHYRGLWLRWAELDYLRPPERLARLGRSQHGNYALDEATRAQLERRVREIVERELLADSALQRAGAPGEDVLELHLRVGKLRIEKPLDASDATDITLADSLGAISFEAELRDSTSGTLLARLAERRRIQTETQRPIRMRSADALFETRRLTESWARRLRGFLAGLPALEESEASQASRAP